MESTAHKNNRTLQKNGVQIGCSDNNNDYKTVNERVGGRWMGND